MNTKILNAKCADKCFWYTILSEDSSTMSWTRVDRPRKGFKCILAEGPFFLFFSFFFEGRNQFKTLMIYFDFFFSFSNTGRSFQ